MRLPLSGRLISSTVWSWYVAACIVNVPRITLRVALCGGAGGCDDDDDYGDDLVYACGSAYYVY